MQILGLWFCCTNTEVSVSGDCCLTFLP